MCPITKLIQSRSSSNGTRMMIGNLAQRCKPVTSPSASGSGRTRIVGGFGVCCKGFPDREARRLFLSFGYPLPSEHLESFSLMCVLDVVLMFRVYLGFCFHPKAI